MKQLTRKYVFECALRGKRIKMPMESFCDTELLMCCGLISDYDENKICYVLHDMAVVYPNVTHDLSTGTPLVNMDRKVYRARKALIYKDL